MKLAAILRRSPPVEPADTGAGRWVAALLADRDRGPAAFSARLVDLRMKVRTLSEDDAARLLADVIAEADRCAPGLSREVRRVVEGRPG